MANTKELSVEDKLRALYDLQLIDTRIDEIRNVRGELPLEVEDLEDEVAGLSTRLEKLKNDLTVIEDQIKAKKLAIDEHNESMKRYIKQQDFNFDSVALSNDAKSSIVKKIETNYGVYYSNLNGEISISSNEEIKNVSYVSYLTKNNLKINSDTIIKLTQLE